MLKSLGIVHGEAKDLVRAALETLDLISALLVFNKLSPSQGYDHFDDDEDGECLGGQMDLVGEQNRTYPIDL